MNLGAQTNQPRLAKQVRLQSDPANDRAALLHQQAVILPNYSGYGILRLRDGKHALETRFPTAKSILSQEVLQYLEVISQKVLIERT
jgi:hypothetical protein